MRSPINQKHIGTAQGWHSWQSRQWSMCLVFLKGTLWGPQIISNQCIVWTPQGYLDFDFSTSPGSQNDVPELGLFFLSTAWTLVQGSRLEKHRAHRRCICELCCLQHRGCCWLDFLPRYQTGTRGDGQGGQKLLEIVLANLGWLL